MAFQWDASLHACLNILQSLNIRVKLRLLHGLSNVERPRTVIHKGHLLLAQAMCAAYLPGQSPFLELLEVIEETTTRANRGVVYSGIKQRDRARPFPAHLLSYTIHQTTLKPTLHPSSTRST